MDKEKIVALLKDLFTLRTVWIDRGGGRWTVKKRFHPALRSSFWVLAVIFGAGIYSSLNNPADSEAIARPVAVQPVKEEKSISAPVAKTPRPQISIPTTPKPKRNEITLPSESNPGTDRIISGKANLTPKTAPAPKITDNGKYNIDVNKSAYTLSLYKGKQLVKEYPIAVGKNPGDKQRIGDYRTPTGNFKIVSIENASGWSHDFRDGKGKIKGAYGPWFLRLDAKGWKGIGIHGTHDPDSRGTMATEGCIRLSNEDIAELRQYAYKNMPVTIREN